MNCHNFEERSIQLSKKVHKRPAETMKDVVDHNGTRTEGEMQNSAAGKPRCFFVNCIISVPDNTYNVLIFYVCSFSRTGGEASILKLSVSFVLDQEKNKFFVVPVGNILSANNTCYTWCVTFL